MATKTATATAAQTPPEQAPRAVSAILADLAGVTAREEAIKRQPGASGTDLLHAQADKVLLGAELARAEAWEADAPRRAALEEAKVHERVLQHAATEGERRIEAAMARIQAAHDDYIREVRATNNGCRAAMAFARAKGHLLPPGHVDMGVGGAYVRVGDGSYCLRAEPWIAGHIAYTPPPSPREAPAPAPAGCRHRNMMRLLDSEDKMNGVYNHRRCMDCGQTFPPD